MEEKVLEIIKNSDKALTYAEIFSKLENDGDKLTETLIKLEQNLKIRVTNKGKYEIFSDKTMKIGTLVTNARGFGFVVVDGEDKDYYVSADHINGAINGDVVVISVINEQRKEAIIRSIKERNLKDLLVGEFYVKDGKNFVRVNGSLSTSSSPSSSSKSFFKMPINLKIVDNRC